MTHFRCQFYQLALIVFVHSSRSHSNGAHYNVVTPAPGCDGKPKHMGSAMYDAIQFFESPGYPNNYPNNAECTWIIESEKLQDVRAVEINFDVFETENVSDFLEIRDGKDSNGILLGRFHGHHDSSFKVVSRSEAMWIRFHSNSQKTYKGFMGRYLSVHSDRLIEVKDHRLLILCTLGGVLIGTSLIIFALCVCTRRKNANSLQVAAHTVETDGTRPPLLYMPKYQDHRGPPPCYKDLV